MYYEEGRDYVVKIDASIIMEIPKTDDLVEAVLGVKKRIIKIRIKAYWKKRNIFQ
ncbi:hypothetical protein [Acidianus brierleyi]|uniref:hypothetical protein n=1 Tax=Acidianus brierleyi TaxID=41673 RepID=UPI001443374A|nr:hypothetical protein [Acidianus brierleyi]